MNILVFDKSNNYDLIDSVLTLDEFKCRCKHPDCTRTLVLHSTIKSFERLRDRYSKPIRITSGFRCQKHNLDVGGSFNSYHKIGAAIDIQPWMKPTNLPDYQSALDKLQECAEKYYDVVIRYNEFIHCNNYGDKGEVQ